MKGNVPAGDFRSSFPVDLTERCEAAAKGTCGSALEELRDHFSVHIGQAEVAALIFECQFRVIDPEAMQKSGMKVMNMHWVFGHVV